MWVPSGEYRRGGALAGGKVSSDALGSVSFSPQVSRIMPCETEKSSERLSEPRVFMEQSRPRWQHFAPSLSRKSNPRVSSRSCLSQEKHTKGRDGTSCLVRSPLCQPGTQGKLRVAGPLPQREGCSSSNSCPQMSPWKSEANVRRGSQPWITCPQALHWAQTLPLAER